MHFDGKTGAVNLKTAYKLSFLFFSFPKNHYMSKYFTAAAQIFLKIPLTLDPALVL